MPTNQQPEPKQQLRLGQKVRYPSLSVEGEVVGFVIDELTSEFSYQMLTLTANNIDASDILVAPKTPNPWYVLRVIVKSVIGDYTHNRVFDPSMLEIVEEQ